MKKLMVIIFSLLFVFTLFNPLTSEAKSKQATAYNKILKNIYTHYGTYIGSKNKAFYNGEGLMYDRLIDFDHNKVKELYVLYGTGDGNIIEEVWTYKNKKVKRVFKKAHYSAGLASDLERSIIKVNKCYYLLDTNMNRGEHYSLYKFNGTKFVQQLSIGASDYETGKMEYFRSNSKGIKKISKSKYISYYKKYNIANRSIIIKSDLGSKSLAKIKTSYKSKPMKKNFLSDKTKNYSYIYYYYAENGHVSSKNIYTATYKNGGWESNRGDILIEKQNANYFELIPSHGTSIKIKRKAKDGDKIYEYGYDKSYYFGRVTNVEATVKTQAGTFKNCTAIKKKDKDGDVYTYYYAPNNGEIKVVKEANFSEQKKVVREVYKITKR